MLTEEPALIEEFVRVGKARLVFRDVLSQSERSLRAHEAAACAARQGLFWDMHEMLFRDQDEVWSSSEAELTGLMKKKASTILGMDSAQFAACMDGRQTLARLQASDAEQRRRGINAQPIFEIGAQRIIGRRPLAGWRELLSAALR